MNNIEQYERLQKKLARQVIQADELPEAIRYMAGTDVEYDKESEVIVGAIVVLNYKTKVLIEAATHRMAATFPYIPGLFSFREMPPLLEAYKKLVQKPDVIICDGHGLAHPRRFGLACHLGIELNIPTIGCGKTRLCGQFDTPAIEKGSATGLFDEVTQEELGRALRTQVNVNPVFVSVGHKISLETACRIVLECCTTYRLPETTRLADQYAWEAFLKAKL